MSESSKHISLEDLALEPWKDSCAICFQLAPELIQKQDDAGPYHVLANRLSYLMAELEPALAHFNSIMKDPSDFAMRSTTDSSKSTAASWDHGEIWLESNGQPLRWHYPLGVLYDLYHRQDEKELSLWTITVHVGSFPETEVLRYKDVRTIKSHFFNTLKQGLYVKYGTTKAVMSLPKNDQEELWKSFISGDGEQHLSCQRKMLTSTHETDVRAFPLRIASIRHGEGFQVEQESVAFDSGDGSLGSVLQRTLPGSSSDKGVLVAGVNLSLDAPVAEVYEAFAHPDQFLYIVI